MIDIDDRLSKKFHQQMDGVYAQDEEQHLCLVAQSYAICENSIAVLSNLRTDQSHIFFGKSCEILGLGKSNTIQTVDSVWEEEIYNRIHPDDRKRRCLQELTFSVWYLHPIQKKYSHGTSKTPYGCAIKKVNTTIGGIVSFISQETDNKG
ncbi:hypothetical protein [uncultured Bacteroides sp.]|jgi:hypothetical protein|uniref:hypothetical protein n=1 Tax=uncultured Bacteroides sp. TaxID=162156 RepID=UPI00280C3916|nr:hypothetical protein [uncultured Bacteroides sp.]